MLTCALIVLVSLSSHIIFEFSMSYFILVCLGFIGLENSKTVMLSTALGLPIIYIILLYYTGNSTYILPKELILGVVLLFHSYSHPPPRQDTDSWPYLSSALLSATCCLLSPAWTLPFSSALLWLHIVGGGAHMFTIWYVYYMISYNMTTVTVISLPICVRKSDFFISFNCIWPWMIWYTLVYNPRVLLAIKVDLGYFCFINLPFLLPPTPVFFVELSFVLPPSMWLFRLRLYPQHPRRSCRILPSRGYTRFHRFRRLFNRGQVLVGGV